MRSRKQDRHRIHNSIFDQVLESQADLRTVYKQPAGGSVQKNIGHIDHYFQGFIALSPFLCLGTVGPDGLGDVTPRGGESGFVHVLDPKHLAIPDRPGNNRLDSLSNIVEQAGVGLLFFIPGFEETLRVNGEAIITTDEALMQRFVVDGKTPRSVIVIEVKEAYLHCNKAVKRSELWNPAKQVERSSFPSAGQIYRDQLALDAEEAAVNAMLDKDAKENLY